MATAATKGTRRRVGRAAPPRRGGAPDDAPRVPGRPAGANGKRTPARVARAAPERFPGLGRMDGLMKPAQMQGTLKEVDPVCLMVTVDGLVHWHLANDGFYRSVLGRGLDDPEVVRRAREHVTQVVLRTMGLE